MKLAINRQFGGFRLSMASQIHVAERKGIKVYPYISKLFSRADYMDMTKTFIKYTGLAEETFDQLELFQKDPQVDQFVLKDMSTDWDGYIQKFKPWKWEPDKNRTDKDLIATILADGDAANTRVSELEIVEVPDGYDYKIDDYDGMETVYIGKDLRTIN
ncbi:hypothetical protein [Lactobacillus plantarum] [Lactiplantibacillus mudanjiangensis]|uniref:hypothetical protein n=1 Tax=Lactiplantibacillus mudanjiangensis TaxID=1296538 RepID=UPI001014956F|nr:hypothetical protein [Lactiplantibacillus mudanjiangensis]VDG33364.1 hypothetical protein [Lactobacillus plantarum] [Lactiplantibacillus mudanjiangensis]